MQKKSSRKRGKALFSLSPEVISLLAAEAERTGQNKSRIIEDRYLMKFSFAPDVERWIEGQMRATGLDRLRVIQLALEGAIRAEARRSRS